MFGDASLRTGRGLGFRFPGAKRPRKNIEKMRPGVKSRIKPVSSYSKRDTQCFGREPSRGDVLLVRIGGLGE